MVKTIKTLAIIKWLMLVPISSHEPSSFTIKKKLRVIISVVENTIKKRLNGASSKVLAKTPKTALTMKKGINKAKVTKLAIKNGSKIVVSRYTDFKEKLAKLATFRKTPH